MIADGTNPWFVERIEHADLPLLVVHDAAGDLVCVVLGADEAELDLRAEEAGVSWVEHRGAPTPAATQLREYLEGRRVEFELSVDPVGTDFERDAWRALQAIPYGETRSYGQQARLLGRAGAARAVGRANGKNPLPIIIPCHRVIGSDGRLTGFAGGLDAKRWLLEHEAAQGSLRV